MTLSQPIISKLWWSVFRWPFEPLARRLFGKSSRILFGPMKGLYLEGVLSQILGIYEAHIQDIMFQNLKEGDVFYDVGGSNGFFTLLAAKRVGLKGHIYAFEPFPENIKRFQETIRDNQIFNCTIIPEAVSNMTETIGLYFDRDGITASVRRGPRNNYLDVRTTTLDEFISSHPSPNLIKVDVEGAEVFVLRGAVKLLTSDPAPTWIIEIHSKEIDLEIKGFLESYRYESNAIVSQHKRQKLYPRHVLAKKVIF